MNLKIDAYSSNHSVLIDTGDSFKNQLDRMEEMKYCFDCGFSLYETDEYGDVIEGGLIAEVHGILFDKDKILNDNLTLDEVADWTDGDAFGGMVHLLKSKVFKEEIDEDKFFMPLFECYISTLYVYPKYRNQGLGKYIFENLCDILEHCFNVTIHCIYIYPNPQVPKKVSNLTSWVDLDDNKKDDMKKHMISVLHKAGYRRLGKNTGYFVLNCAAKTI